MKIPITRIDLNREDEINVLKTMRSGWLTQGKKVAEFEEAVAGYVGAGYAVATSSCTSALHISLIAAGVCPGDEVIVPSYSFVATANAVLYCGARPVFADIDPLIYNIDPDKIQALISEKTKAIIAVHQVGLAADMDKIQALAGKYNLKVIEDAACALGSEYKGKKIGSLSEFTCFSFHPKKIIATGEGGMVTTKRKDFAKMMRILRNHGASVSDLERHSIRRIVFEKYKLLGFNYRMPDILAALGVSQMGRLPEILKRRRHIAKIYNDALANQACIDLPDVPAFVKPNYQSYIIRINENSSFSRDKIMEGLLERGVVTRRIMAIHMEPYYAQRYQASRLRETERAVKTAMLIPIYNEMRSTEQDYVIASLLDILKKDAKKQR